VEVIYTHFNPRQWVIALSNVSRLLVDDGLLIYDETSRVHNITDENRFQGGSSRGSWGNRVVLYFIRT
jgi:hypothetical protein